MPMRGHWRLAWDGGTTILNPGDTCAVPPGLPHTPRAVDDRRGQPLPRRATDDPAGRRGRRRQRHDGCQTDPDARRVTP